MKVYIIAVLIGIVGFGLGLQIGQAPEQPAPVASNPNPSLQVPSCPPPPDMSAQHKQTLQEAASLYGKAFQLFLASLGVSLNKSQQEALQQLLDSPQSFNRPAESLAYAEVPESEKIVNPCVPAEALFHNPQKVRSELKLEQTDENSDLINRATKKILADPGLFQLRAQYATSIKDIHTLNGQYTGVIIHVTGPNKGKVDSLTLRIDYRPKSASDSSALEGTCSLILSRDGVVYNDSTSSGENRRIRLNQGQLILEAGPNSFLHFTNRSLTEANFYSDHKFVGVAKLEKY